MAANTYITNGIKLAHFEQQLSKVALEKSVDQKNKLLGELIKSLHLMAHVLGYPVQEVAFQLGPIHNNDFNARPSYFLAQRLIHSIDKPPKTTI
jgi:hypothetical protein